MKKGKNISIKEILLNNFIIFLGLILSAFYLWSRTDEGGGLSIFEGMGEVFLIFYVVVIVFCIYLFIRQIKIDYLKGKFIYLYSSLVLIFLLIIIISLSLGPFAFIWMVCFVIPLPVLVILIDLLIKKIKK